MTIRITFEERQQLQALACRSATTLSAVVRALLVAGLEAADQPEARWPQHESSGNADDERVNSHSDGSSRGDCGSDGLGGSEGERA